MSSFTGLRSGYDLESFLRFIARNFPALLLVMLSAYGVPAYITALGSIGWVRFLSRRGCTQGCPAGGLCFAAALQEVLEATQAAFPACIVIALHDDVEVCGPPDQARAALPRASARRGDPALRTYALWA